MHTQCKRCKRDVNVTISRARIICAVCGLVLKAVGR